MLPTDFLKHTLFEHYEINIASDIVCLHSLFHSDLETSFLHE